MLTRRESEGNIFCADPGASHGDVADDGRGLDGGRGPDGYCAVGDTVCPDPFLGFEEELDAIWAKGALITETDLARAEELVGLCNAALSCSGFALGAGGA